MFLKKIFGTSSQRKIKKILPLVNHINEYYESLRSKSDQELMERTNELKQYVEDARSKEKNSIDKNLDREVIKKKILEAEQKALDDIMVEAFAMVKETCRRMMGQ